MGTTTEIMEVGIAACWALVAVAASGSLRPGAQAPLADDELVLRTPAPVDEEIQGELEGFERSSCAICHEEIAREWSTTLHAFAWVDPRYKKELRGKRRPESCHGCHAPAPLFQAEALGEKPPARSEELQARHFGVSCKSCHLGPEGVVLGPRGGATDAHRTQRSEALSGVGSNALCTACHATTVGPVIGIAKDFETARLEEQGLSCVGCHMAPIERSWATDDEDRPTPVRPGRSHLLQTPRDPAFLAQAFALSTRREGGALVVELRNRAGHRVPGLVGRSLRFLALALAADGETLAEDELVIDDRYFLPVGGVRELVLEPTGAATRVRVVGEHQAPGAREPVPFLGVELVLEVTEDGRR